MVLVQKWLPYFWGEKNHDNNKELDYLRVSHVSKRIMSAVTHENPCQHIHLLYKTPKSYWARPTLPGTRHQRHWALWQMILSALHKFIPLGTSCNLVISMILEETLLMSEYSCYILKHSNQGRYLKVRYLMRNSSWLWWEKPELPFPLSGEPATWEIPSNLIETFSKRVHGTSAKHPQNIHLKQQEWDFCLYSSTYLLVVKNSIVKYIE